MECEEEELEPWQRDVGEEEEEMDDICGFKQTREFVSLSPGECSHCNPRGHAANNPFHGRMTYDHM